MSLNISCDNVDVIRGLGPHSTAETDCGFPESSWDCGVGLSGIQVGGGQGAASYAQKTAAQISLSVTKSHSTRLDDAKRSILNSLNSAHSRRSYDHAIRSFISWYCAEPRLGFNRAVVTRYRSFLESQQLSPATINLSLSAIPRLAL
jgi:hypothetical protein